MSMAASLPWLAQLNTGLPAGHGDDWARLGEKELIALAVGGKPEAYGEIVRRHQNAVYNVALRLLGDSDEALDVTQDAFIRAFAALDKFDPQRFFGPWINRVAANLALNALQRRRPGATLLPDQLPDDIEQPPALADYSAEPERIFLAGEQQETLRRAILSLPAQYRAVIELRHFQELSYAEIAATLAIPISDVRSHLFRARRELRRWLEEHE